MLRGCVDGHLGKAKYHKPLGFGREKATRYEGLRAAGTAMIEGDWPLIRWFIKSILTEKGCSWGGVLSKEPRGSIANQNAHGRLLCTPYPSQKLAWGTDIGNPRCDRPLLCFSDTHFHICSRLESGGPACGTDSRACLYFLCIRHGRLLAYFPPQHNL